MKMYLVDVPWIEHRGEMIYLQGYLEAEDDLEAEKIAEGAGVILIGALDDGIVEDEEVARAQIERMVSNPRMH